MVVSKTKHLYHTKISLILRLIFSADLATENIFQLEHKNSHFNFSLIQ